MKLPWQKSSRSTSRARKRPGAGRSVSMKCYNEDETMPSVVEMKSGDFSRPQDMEAQPDAEIVWDGSDGFDVSPIPSAITLVPTNELDDCSIEHFIIHGFADEHQTRWEVERDENNVLELREFNLQHRGSSIMNRCREVSQVKMNRSEIKSVDSTEECATRQLPQSMLTRSVTKSKDSAESSCKVARITMNRSATRTEDLSESYLGRMVSRMAMNRSASKSKESSLSLSSQKDCNAQSATKTTIESLQAIESDTSYKLEAALRDLMTKSTEHDERQLEGHDKYAVPVSSHTVSGRPMSVLTHNLSICISHLDESVPSHSFSPDWKAGQEVHLERERLRFEFSKSLMTASNDLTQCDRHSPLNRVGCVRWSLCPFHFSCGANLPLLPQEYDAFWSTDDDSSFND